MFTTTRGAKCLRTLCSYQEVSLCLVSQVTLRSSTFASSIVCLAKSHLRSTTSHNCLSQAYGCSDRYTYGAYGRTHKGFLAHGVGGGIPVFIGTETVETDGDDNGDDGETNGSNKGRVSDDGDGDSDGAARDSSRGILL